MAQIQVLDGGEWEFREALGDTWEWYVAQPVERRNSVTQAAGSTAWLPARVPGSVVDDLVRAGEVREPRYARRSREAEWAADRHWVYRRTVDLPQLGARDHVWLELDGVDPGGRVFWDGEELARIEGLHRHHRVAVPARTTSTAAGTHTLAVVIDPALDTEPQVGRTERVRRLAPRVGSGWDFAPRLRHQGIWRGVRLITGPGAIAAVRARTDVDLASRSGTVLVDVDLGGWADAWPEVRAALFLDGEEVVTATVQPSASGAARLRLDVRDVRLWWPTGEGPQTLYRMRVGAAGDERWLRVGFREARLIANVGAPSGALGYTAEVNGRVLPLVGWNWAPADVLFGTVETERVRHLLMLAADSGARLLRVWGGGLLESDDFYDICDELGLLVWQELSQSSSGMQSAPAVDDAFVAHAVAETRAAAERLARHPSLFLWCGGNELEDDAGPLDERRSPVLAAMRDVLAEVDPGRPWLPTSPSGPTFHHRLDRITDDPEGQHDVHGPWEHQGLEGQYRLANAGTSLAHTEFGVEGMAGLRSLRAMIPADSLWPADRSNPVYRHLGEWWNNAELVSESFGGRLNTIEVMQRASQWLQATGLQYTIEADRRRWPRCSMVLPWQLAESFPNAWCTSAVEWSGEAKPALHAARRAFARERVTIRVPRAAWERRASMTAEAWVWSEAGAPAGTTVRLVLRNVFGAVLAQRVSETLPGVAAPAPVLALEAPLPEADGLVLWEARWTAADGSAVDVERAVATATGDFGPLLDLGTALVDAHVEEDADTWRVRVSHTGGPAAIGLGLRDARPWRAPGRFIARDDPRPLLPGESRTLEVRWFGVPRDDRLLSLDAFNLSPLPLTTTGRSTSP